MYVALFAKLSDPTNEGIRVHQLDDFSLFGLCNIHASIPEFYSLRIGAQSSKNKKHLIQVIPHKNLKMQCLEITSLEQYYAH